MSDAIETVMDLVSDKYKKENKTALDKKSRIVKTMILDLLLASKFL